MGKVKVFLDTDVIISALLSKTGASFEIIKSPKVDKIVSTGIEREVAEVAKRLKIDRKDVKRVLKNCQIKSLSLTKKNIIDKYSSHVFDKEDAHVIAGADLSESKFLLTHNVRHYNADRINNKLRVIVLKPGNFLQYLRSREKF